MERIYKKFIVMGIIVFALFGCTQAKTKNNGHSFETTWSSDEKTHWHACTDKGYEDLVSDKAEHTPSEWIIDEEPTATEQGTKYKKCDVCGRRLVEETIDKTPDEVADNPDLIFTELDSGNYSVKAKSQSVEKVVIPSMCNGKPVTMIEEDAFYNCSYLTSITIPNNITSIGWGAFSHCTSLTSITIPNSVTYIGRAVFENCESLTSITIPNAATYIGDNAFQGCTSLASITIPNNVTYIGRAAFENCESLTSITIPSSVTSIGSDAFSYCESLTSITIPNSITSIGKHAFCYCTSLKTINFDGTTAQWNAINKGEGWNGTLTRMVINSVDGHIIIDTNETNLIFTPLDSGSYSVKAASQSVEKVVIPSTYNGKLVTTIEKFAFYNCFSITSITIPDSVTSIGKYAFHYCDSITSITIPNSVTYIGDSAFSYCESLTSIIVPDNVTSIGEDAFSDCFSLTSITIPNSVTSIGKHAFYYCTSLKTINFDGTTAQWNAINKGEGWNNETPTNMAINPVDPDLIFTQLDSGNYSVKAASKSIEEVIIRSTYNGKPVTTIEKKAFSTCYSLTSITIPISISSIGEYAFYGCKSLTSITIPDSVTSIGFAPFYWCTSLQTIIFGGTKEQWNTINKDFDCWTGRSVTTSLVLHCSDGDINYL